VDNALENAEQNNCRHITVRQQNQPPQGPVFDVVLANINRHILLENMAAMQEITQPGGLLLLSGLLVADEASIVEAAENEGLSCFKMQERAGWLALLLKKSFR
jgi:ribosomal protein L11 methyltransferase